MPKRAGSAQSCRQAALTVSEAQRSTKINFLAAVKDKSLLLTFSGYPSDVNATSDGHQYVSVPFTFGAPLGPIFPSDCSRSRHCQSTGWAIPFSSDARHRDKDWFLRLGASSQRCRFCRKFGRHSAVWAQIQSLSSCHRVIWGKNANGRIIEATSRSNLAIRSDFEYLFHSVFINQYWFRRSGSWKFRSHWCRQFTTVGRSTLANCTTRRRSNL